MASVDLGEVDVLVVGLGPVGAALLWTLGQGLGAAFTPAVAGAWTEAYTVLAGVMKDAAAA